MFALTGAGSIISLLLLITVFDGKRFEPDWVTLFQKCSEAKMPTNTPKNKSSILVDYHESVIKARNNSIKLEQIKAIKNKSQSYID